MSEVNETEATGAAAPSPVGPGKRLYQARERLGLPIEDAAKQLKLSPRHLNALESDDYDQLAGPTYVRGYLRSYSQLLGLPAEEIVATYNELVEATRPRVETATTLSPPAQASSDDRLVKLGTVVVIGLVFGLAFAWWLGQGDRLASPPPVATGAEQSPATQSYPPPATDPYAGETTASEPDSRPIIATGNTGFEAPPAPAAPPAAPLVPAVPGLPPAAVLPKIARPAESLPREPAPVPAQAPPPARVSEPMPAAAVSANDARARLVIRAREASWIDVRDGNQNKLLYETITAGRMVSLEGPPPLRVFVGNADGVEIEYNGAPYDVSRHKRGQVARFSLPGPAEPQP